MFSEQFKAAYAKSLADHFRSFYDDLNEYGNPQARHCIYFIHGIDGSPGQIRFALPAASRFFKNDMYIRGLHTPAFSSRNLIWDKYTLSNLDLRVQAIVNDLTELAQRFGRVIVFCSSNGFYDFYAAASKLDAATRACITLFWVACAPDYFDDTIWEHVFFKINGFVNQGYRWVALPNSNLLRWLNPEVPYRHVSMAQKPHKFFYKHDMESRFYIYGSLWSYFSIGCFNDCLAHLIGQTKAKLSIPTYALAAEFDGYWQGKSVADMKQLMEKYVENPVILSRPTSHLWIASPEHVYAVLQLAFGGNGEKLRTEVRQSA